MKYEAKENHSRRGNCLLNITYYKLWGEKHFAYYIIGQGVEGYRVGGARKIINQMLMLPGVHRVWKAVGKKTKIVARTGLCSSQCHGSTMMNAMKSDLPNTVRDVMKANHRYGAPGVDESRRVLRHQSEAF